MKHYKDFIIKLQTLDIKTRQKRQVESGSPKEFSIYTISHQNPYLSDSFRNELKELKELALIDILNLSGEQIQLQLQRLDELKEQFQKFWHNLRHSHVPGGSEHLTDLLYSLNLTTLFIVPELSFQDHARADDDFMSDLQDTIRAREKALEEFEQSVLKVIQPGKEGEKTNKIKPVKKEEPMPVFKEGMAAEFYDLVKDYFKPVDQPHLKNLLAGEATISHPLVFSGTGNQLADAFKQLFEANLIIGCNKAQLISWLMDHFEYSDKRTGKDLKRFSNELQKKGIHVAVRQNTQGVIYGVTYVDHVNKTVFNGSDIGKEYGAKGLLEKLSTPVQKEGVSAVEKPNLTGAKTEDENVAGEIKKSIESSNLWADLLQPLKQDNFLSKEFKKKRKKRAKRWRL